jgi:hypothetical protein
MKQETLEEFAERFVSTTRLKNPKSLIIEGAKWQKQQSYSKEEVLEHLNHLIIMRSSELDLYTNDEEIMTVKWFEQF